MKFRRWQVLATFAAALVLPTAPVHAEIVLDSSIAAPPSSAGNTGTTGTTSTTTTAGTPTTAGTTSTTSATSIASTTGTTSTSSTASQMRHLPDWVQVTSKSAHLYVADTGSQTTGKDLPRFTFLRVVAGGDHRLQVERIKTADAGERGWVDTDAVEPSAPGTDWLVVARATSLWSSAGPAAAGGRKLDRFTPLQRLDGPTSGRVQVRVYARDFSKVEAQGWVAVEDTGPAVAPETRVLPPDAVRPASRSQALSTPSGDQAAFIAAVAAAAQAAHARTGVPVSVTIAQAILESDWGRSGLSVAANNFFGVKATASLGNDGAVWMPTSEYDTAGQVYQTTSAFRAYKSLVDSVLDHNLLLRNGARYAPAMRVASDPRQFAQQLSLAGYSTDPGYATKLIALMDRYDLYRFDG